MNLISKTIHFITFFILAIFIFILSSSLSNGAMNELGSFLVSFAQTLPNFIRTVALFTSVIFSGIFFYLTFKKSQKEHKSFYKSLKHIFKGYELTSIERLINAVIQLCFIIYFVLSKLAK